MKHILLLTDFSDIALNAIKYALHFFKNETCTFHILNVHKMGSYTSDDLMRSPKESIYQSITKEPREKLNYLVGNLKNEFNNANHTFEIHIDFEACSNSIMLLLSKSQYFLMSRGSI